MLQILQTQELQSQQLDYDHCNRKKFNYAVPSKDYDNEVNCLERKGIKYEPDAIHKQIEFLQTNFYKTTGAGKDQPRFKIFQDGEDIKTNDQEIRNALARKFPNNLQPLIYQHAVYFVESVTSTRYLPYSCEPFVIDDCIKFRNSYRPAHIKPTEKLRIRPPIWQDYLDRIMPREQLCWRNGEQAAPQQIYFEQLLAQRVQSPADPCTVAILLRGDQGTGKNFWCDVLMQALVGKTNHQTLSLSDVKGDFIAGLYKKTLAHIEEINCNRTQTADRLKPLVTQEKAYVRDPYIPKYSAQKYFLLALSTNTYDPIRIERGDRRYFICEYIRHRQSSQESEEFFNRFAVWLEQQDGYQKMCNWLNSVDIKNVNFRSPPQTDAKIDLTERETSAEGNTQLASLELSTTYKEYAFLLKSVQDTWKLTQPSAITALRNAGFTDVKKRWNSGDPYTLWFQKDCIPKNNYDLRVDIFMDKKSNALGLRCGNEDTIKSNWTDITE